MRSIEDKGVLNHVSPQEISSGGPNIHFEFHKGNGTNRASHHRTALGKPTPSKWDDAQKWLVNLSRGGGERNHSKTDQPRNSNADDRRLIAPVPKKEYSSSEDEEGHGIMIPYGEETKNVDCVVDHSVWRVNPPSAANSTSIVRSICVRDMGTEMTPIASQEPSRTTTPIRNTTPAARSPISSGSTTPIRCQNGVVLQQPLESADSSRGEPGRAMVSVARFSRERDQESNASNVAENKSSDPVVAKPNPLETRAMAWDEAERAKYMARYKREEVKIQAWENHEKRKAEMEMKRMEAKADRLKSRAQEKFTNKVASTRRIAEEKRAKAEAHLNEKAVRTSERADYIRRTGHLPSSFSIKLPSFCW